MIKFLRCFRKILYTVLLSPYIINSIKNKSILCEAYMSYSFQKMINKNWGDDLNKYFFEHITGLGVVNLPISCMLLPSSIHSYSLIGSILSFYSLENKIIYGSGIQDPSIKLKGSPYKIASVRGPKTRGILVLQGYDCPEYYGDPALLLPVFYKPNYNKSERGCLIVNMGTNINKNKVAINLTKLLNLKVVSMTEYDKWTDVIDEIVSSSYVISESLHGLIVAETYGVPNVWVEFKEHPDYWDFKFEDYYESIGKSEKILKLHTRLDISLILKKIKEWERGDINYNKLLTYFPYNINCKVNHKDLKNKKIKYK